MNLYTSVLLLFCYFCGVCFTICTDCMCHTSAIKSWWLIIIYSLTKDFNPPGIGVIIVINGKNLNLRRFSYPLDWVTIGPNFGGMTRSKDRKVGFWRFLEISLSFICNFIIVPVVLEILEFFLGFWRSLEFFLSFHCYCIILPSQFIWYFCINSISRSFLTGCPYARLSPLTVDLGITCSSSEFSLHGSLRLLPLWG